MFTHRTAGSNPAPSAIHYGVHDVENLGQHIDFVKSQLEFQQRQAARFAKEPRRAALHEASALQFRSLLGDLIELKDWISAHPNWRAEKEKDTTPKRLALTWEEVEGLPKEVLDELSISDSDRTEFNIIAAIRALGGIASLDRIIICLFNQTGEINKRMTLNQRLYRMTQKELIHGVPGKKGVYSLEVISDEDASKIV